MSKFKYHFVYKTMCLITGKFYIGKHSTNNLNDRYLGSGVRIQRSVKKHGADSHCRAIIALCDSSEQACKREQEIVNDRLLSDPNCLNLTRGGTGGPTRQGMRHSEETKQKTSAALMGHTHSDETKKKIGAKSLGRGKGRKLSEEQRQKMRGPSEAKRLGQLRRWATIGRRKGE